MLAFKTPSYLNGLSDINIVDVWLVYVLTFYALTISTRYHSSLQKKEFVLGEKYIESEWSEALTFMVDGKSVSKIKFTLKHPKTLTLTFSPTAIAKNINPEFIIKRGQFKYFEMSDTSFHQNDFKG